MAHMPHLKTWAGWTFNCLYPSENKMGYLCTPIARGGQRYLSKLTGRDEEGHRQFLSVLQTWLPKSVADFSEVGI